MGVLTSSARQRETKPPHLAKDDESRQRVIIPAASIPTVLLFCLHPVKLAYRKQLHEIRQLRRCTRAREAQFHQLLTASAEISGRRLLLMMYRFFSSTAHSLLLSHRMKHGEPSSSSLTDADIRSLLHREAKVRLLLGCRLAGLAAVELIQHFLLCREGEGEEDG